MYSVLKATIEVVNASNKGIKLKTIQKEEVTNKVLRKMEPGSFE